jgi:hypothetical protein
MIRSPGPSVGTAVGTLTMRAFGAPINSRVKKAAQRRAERLKEPQ